MRLVGAREAEQRDREHDRGALHGEACPERNPNTAILFSACTNQLTTRK